LPLSTSLISSVVTVKENQNRKVAVVFCSRCLGISFFAYSKSNLEMDLSKRSYALKGWLSGLQSTLLIEDLALSQSRFLHKSQSQDIERILFFSSSSKFGNPNSNGKSSPLHNSDNLNK
jgi:hypothetical protein